VNRGQGLLAFAANASGSNTELNWLRLRKWLLVVGLVTLALSVLSGPQARLQPAGLTSHNDSSGHAPPTSRIWTSSVGRPAGANPARRSHDQLPRRHGLALRRLGMIDRRQIGGGRMAEDDGPAVGADLANGAHDPRPRRLPQKSSPSRVTTAAHSPWTALRLPQKVCSYLR
jgi:hypothetical protein